MAGTHGRGLWILDDITPLQQMTTQVQQAEAHLFRNRPTVQWLSVQPQHGGGALAFRGQNPTRNAVINFYVSNKVTGDVRFEVASADGLNTCSATLQPGANGYTTGHRPARVDDALVERSGRRARGWRRWTRRWWRRRRWRTRGRRRRSCGRRCAAGAASFPSSATAAPAGGRGGGGGGGGGRGGGGGAAQVEPGTYRVTMTANGKTYTSTVTLRPDPMEKYRSGTTGPESRRF